MGDLAKLYDAIWASGQDHGIADFGVHAVNSLRMEKGYRGFGAELTNEITLIEADCERFYAPGKGDFKGRAATENLRQQGDHHQTSLWRGGSDRLRHLWRRGGDAG